MKLRKKISVIVLIVWSMMLIVTYTGSRLIFDKSYLDLEQKEADASLQRVNQAIKQMNATVSTTTANWAIWDETYRFMEDHNKAYQNANLNMGSMQSADIDFLGILDTTGKPIALLTLNPERTKFTPIPDRLMSYLTPKSVISYQPKADSAIQGLILIPSGIWMVSAHAIVKGDGAGPVRGTLIMAKHLSANDLNKIKQITQLDVSLLELNNQTMNPFLKSIYQKLNKNQYYIERTNEKTMLGYGLLYDVNHQPIAIIKTVLPRSLYLFGIKTIRYYNAILFIYISLLVFALWYLLQELLVKRLELLKSKIGSDNIHLPYLNYFLSGGSDEVSTVANLYHQATHDPLTGLANRTLLDKAFNIQTKKNKSIKLALIFIDIDYFKHVNDLLGHAVGDALLIKIAETLNTCLRKHDLSVRLGGDEFVLLLSDINQQIVDQVVKRIYSSFSRKMMVNEHELMVGISMGISIYPDNGETIAELLSMADIALYHAKGIGRNRYQYYSEQLNQAIQALYQREIELQKALDNKELCLYYQPIYDMTEKKIISLEALIRWNHPTHGLIGATEIITIAEKSGLIIPIGKWVLHEACLQAKKWQEKGILSHPIAVNLSVSQIKNTSINHFVNETLGMTGLQPSMLELELTETSYIDIDETILNDMRLLKKSGINLIVDDFGVGYSGLGYLRSLPVSKLKIDRSFINNITTNADDRSITLAIIAIAHQLNLKVIAEGVETEEQFQLLKSSKVDGAQGMYLNRPLSQSDCENLLSARETRGRISS